MNLQKLASYIILIWLPLVDLKLHKQTSFIDRLRNETKSETPTDIKTENFVESIEEKMEENSNKKENSSLRGRASENFPEKPSANLGIKLSGTKKSAHKQKGSVKKDLSALNSYNTNKSAAIIKGKKKLNKKNDFLSKIFKRDVIKKVAMSEDPNSLDEYDDEEFEENEKGNSTDEDIPDISPLIAAKGIISDHPWPLMMPWQNFWDVFICQNDWFQFNSKDRRKVTNEMGSYLGAPCELTCSEKLLHVFCDPQNRVCECEEKYPVQIGVGRGCEKPKQLGDQCFYAQTCSFFDPNAVCTQINHNAICQCKPGFHTVALRKGVKKMFCSEDIAAVSADLPTLLGVATGIAVLTGLLCFVLRLFSGNRYPSARHYGNANIAPPLLLSNDNQWITGIPLTVHGRPSSKSSCQRSTMSLAQYSRNKGVLVPASRAGAARAAAILLIPCRLQAPRHSEVVKGKDREEADVQTSEVEQSSRLGSRRHSFSSVQSTTSSQKSMTYSARRFEQENQQREQRAAVRIAREEIARGVAPPTPSPISTDELILASKNPEEDPLCSATTGSAPQSEPPALSINKTVAQNVPSSSSPTQ